MGKLFDVKLVFTEIPQLLKYLPVTLELTGTALIIGWLLGLVLAMVKIRNIPVLSQISALFVFDQRWSWCHYLAGGLHYRGCGIGRMRPRQSSYR